MDKLQFLVLIRNNGGEVKKNSNAIFSKTSHRVFKKIYLKVSPYRSTERHDRPPEIRGAARGPKCGATSPPQKNPHFRFSGVGIIFHDQYCAVTLTKN